MRRAAIRSGQAEIFQDRIIPVIWLLSGFLFMRYSIAAAAAFSTLLSAQSCLGAAPEKERESVLRERLESAHTLIERGHSIERRQSDLIERAGLIAQKDRSESRADFNELSAKYQEALAEYTRHRQAYFEHCKKYHSHTPPRASAQFFPSFSADDLKPLKLKVGEKCKELQDLENKLSQNEQNLQTLITNYEIATQKESDAVLSQMWSEAESQAIANQSLVLQFNHLGTLKTSQSSSKIHDMITAANRDGAYGAQQTAWKDYQQNNQLQEQFFKKANQHARFEMMIMRSLQSMKPRGVMSQGPIQPGVSGGDLESESNQLEAEYNRLQSMFARLKEMQKSLGSR